MKNLLTLIIFLLPFATIAQNADSTKSKRTEEYCEIVATQKLFSAKLNIQVDYGEPQTFWNRTGYLKGDDGKMATFNSVVDVLNYMNGLGWNFLNAYPVSEANGPKVYHYLMKRKILN